MFVCYKWVEVLFGVGVEKVFVFVFIFGSVNVLVC